MKKYILMLCLTYLIKTDITSANIGYFINRSEVNVLSEPLINSTISSTSTKKLVRSIRRIKNFKLHSSSIRRLRYNTSFSLRLRGGESKNLENLESKKIFRSNLSKKEAFYVFMSELLRLIYSLVELLSIILLKFCKISIEYIIKNLETDSSKREAEREERRIRFRNTFNNVQHTFFRLVDLIKPTVNLQIQPLDPLIIDNEVKTVRFDPHNDKKKTHPFIKWFQEKRPQDIKVPFFKLKKS